MAPRKYRPKVKLGVDIFLEENLKEWRKARLGLILNQASITTKLLPTLWALLEKGMLVSALFAPEHGMFGEGEAGEEIKFAIDEQTGIPIYSLYGEARKPTEEMLEDVDVLVWDLPEIGARYSTYISTLVLSMQSAAEKGIPFLVLDRPNPIGGKREGNILDDKFRSFVGMLPIPNRHGLTPAELALYAKDIYNMDLDLRIFPMVGWKRKMFYDDTGLIWVNPSPNLPHLENVLLYPGACLLEGTNISEGRGTTMPFQILGAPWIKGFELAMTLNSNSEGVFFREVKFVPNFSKYKGEQCDGVAVHILDPEIDIVMLYIFIIQTIKVMYPDKLRWLKREKGYVIDYLAGTDLLRRTMDELGSFSEVFTLWDEELESFEETIQPYLIYPTSY
ncbi:MAG: exo-beta-N-acetylmuramidase NamZ family protein [bacterium]